MRTSPQLFGICLGALLFDLSSRAAAHGHDEADMSTTSMGDYEHLNHSISDAIAMAKPSYFRHPEHSALILAHIVLMSLAWVFVLPLSGFLLARS
jgi:hypothetical protein